MDYEVRGKKFKDDLEKIDYSIENIELNKTKNIRKYIVPVYKTQIPEQKKIFMWDDWCPILNYDTQMLIKIIMCVLYTKKIKRNYIISIHRLQKVMRTQKLTKYYH